MLEIVGQKQKQAKHTKLKCQIVKSLFFKFFWKEFYYSFITKTNKQTKPTQTTYNWVWFFSWSLIWFWSKGKYCKYNLVNFKTQSIHVFLCPKWLNFAFKLLHEILMNKTVRVPLSLAMYVCFSKCSLVCLLVLLCKSTKGTIVQVSSSQSIFHGNPTF